MSGTKTALRVLYSINGTQYILARSFVPVSYTLIQYEEITQQGGSSGTSQSPARFGSVSLKTCLDTICRSSPELAQDSSRDFSLYVLDPLESNSAPALMNIPNAAGQSSCAVSAEEQARGVAVGYGLMSWALTSEETEGIAANGTLIKQPTGQEALEVVFALRETKPRTLKKPSPSSQTPSSSQESSASQPSSSQGDVKPLQWYSQGSTFSYQSSSTFSRSASTPDLTRETLSSIQLRSKAKAKAPKVSRGSATPMTESDKLMAGDIYIGPQKKKGRPRTTGLEPKSAFQPQTTMIASTSLGSEQEVIVIDDSDDESKDATPKPTSAGCARTEGSKRKRAAKLPTKPPFTTAPLVRQSTETLLTATPPPTALVEVKAEQRDPTVLDLLTLFTSTSTPSEQSVPNAALLAALNAIDSSQPTNESVSSESPPNPVLVEAIRQLLAICAQPAAPPIPLATTAPKPAPQHTTQPVPTSNPASHHRNSSSSQNDVVLLDKENVNPTAFRKRTERAALGKKLSTEGGSVPSSSTSHTERPVFGLGLSRRSNEMQSIPAPLRSASSLPGPDRTARKRTLSDFMDEKETGRKGKGKERERRDSSRRRSQPKPDALRHYPGVLAATLPRQDEPANYYRTPLEPWTSPVRSCHNDENDEYKPSSRLQASPSRSPPKQTSPRQQRPAASSPIRPSKDAGKKYIVPAWARTNTATQPRLSEEAQRALEEAEARKKEERNAARRLAPSATKLARKASTRSLKTNPPVSERQSSEQPPRPQFLVPRQPSFSRGPIAASSDGPIIAFPLVPSSSRSSSPPPNPLVIPKTPKTPSRPRVRSTPGTEDDSLFTPVRRSGASLFGSAFSQRSPNRTPPSILTSPLGNRKKAKLTPTRSLLTGKGIGRLSWSNYSSPKPSTDSMTPEEQQLRLSSSHQEPDEAVDDLDCPPSSLPIASSDMDINEAYSQPSGDVEGDVEEGDAGVEDDDDDTQVQPIQQHWAGLPPSSPLAPSSPMLLPEETRTDDEEMDELPIATSDSETDAEMSTFETDMTSPEEACASPTDDTPTNEQCPAFTDEDYNAFFSMEASPSSAFQQLSPSTTLDLFEQFTNVNAQSDDLRFSPLQSSTTAEGLLDPIDFTEFWETFKPLLSDSSNVQATAEQTTESQQTPTDLFTADDSQLFPAFTNVDHAKLADDMRSLLSGCLM